MAPKVTLEAVKRVSWERPTSKIPLLPEPTVWDHDITLHVEKQVCGLGDPDESKTMGVAA